MEKQDLALEVNREKGGRRSWKTQALFLLLVKNNAALAKSLPFPSGPFRPRVRGEQGACFGCKLYGTQGSDSKEFTCNEGDLGLIPGPGRSFGEGNGQRILAWRIPWTEEPGGLQSMGSKIVRHN